MVYENVMDKMMSRTDRSIHILIGMILIILLPHIPRLPSWVIMWCLCFWSYAIVARRYHWPDPPKILLRLLTILGFAGVLFTYRHTLNLQASVSLLATMAGIKPLETHSYKDRMVIVFTAYFFVIANLNYSTSLSFLVYMFLSVLIITTVLIHINHPRGQLTQQLRQTATIMLQALPLMLILFFLFPRLPGSLVERQDNTGDAVIGFSDTLSPGDIAQLARNTEIAFRVEFQDPVPNSEQLYWRGIVFHYFDGRNWKIDPRRITRTRPLNGDLPIRYSVMLEPHRKHWLFALELPATAPAFARILRENVLFANRIVKKRTQYDVTSYLKRFPDSIGEKDFGIVRLSDKAGNPRTRALARGWKDATDTTEKLVNLALDYFKNGGFAYTLDPPLLGGEIIDDFMFRTRRGYCEHYASAFAFLMQAAGIPARVVGGYLGGEVNPYGDYLMVRQSHAHAWTEVWHEGRGWIRVDPTSVVAPERVAQSAAQDPFPFLINLLGLTEFYAKVKLGWDALNNQWNVWFFSYSFYRQKRLLTDFGIELNSWFDPVTLLVLITCAAGIFIFFFLYLPLKKKNAQHDPVLLRYNKFCEKLAGIGFRRDPAEGPVDYAGRVIAARPDLSAEVQDITRLYVRIRYGRGGDDDTVKSLKALIKRFKPAKQPG